MFIKTQDRQINGVKVRIYKPKSAKVGEKMPTMIYYHGGGYVFGSISKFVEIRLR